MKKVIGILGLLIAFLLVPSCSKQADNNDTSDIELNKIYETNTWDSTLVKMMKYSIGEQYQYVPEFTSISYEVFVSKAKQDNNEYVTYTDIKCFGVSSSSANRLYAEKLEEKEFVIVSYAQYGYRFVDYSSDLFVNYGIYSGEGVEKPFFHIQVSVRNTRETEWDSAFIKEYMEVDVPKCDAKGYNFAYDSYNERILINALFVDDGMLSSYSRLLQSKGYIVTGTDQTDGIQLVDPTGYVTVTIYSMVGEYECNALYIQLDNAWPTLEIGAFTGVYLPKLVSETASYGGWNYYDPNPNDGSTDDYVLLIFYDDALQSDYYGYIEQIVEAGLTKGTTTNNDGVLITPLTATHPNGKKIELSLQYQISSSTICLAVYQAK